MYPEKQMDEKWILWKKSNFLPNGVWVRKFEHLVNKYPQSYDSFIL